jgi:hypothetical protein
MRTFRRLNLADIYLGLEDLFSKRHDALLLTRAGKGQEEVLGVQRDEINALPAAMTGGRAFANELAAADDEHDNLGYALWHLTEAYIRAPGASAETVETAVRVRDAFVPEISALQASYADEAAAAGFRREHLTTLEADLKRLPIDGGSAYDWAAAFVAAGEKLSKLLSQQADVESQTRKNAQLLRSETIGILNDLRRAIAREKNRNAFLPADIDPLIFGYFDTLEENREQAAKTSRESESEEG